VVAESGRLCGDKAGRRRQSMNSSRAQGHLAGVEVFGETLGTRSSLTCHQRKSEAGRFASTEAVPDVKGPRYVPHNAKVS